MEYRRKVLKRKLEELQEEEKRIKTELDDLESKAASYMEKLVHAFKHQHEPIVSAEGLLNMFNDTYEERIINVNIPYTFELGITPKQRPLNHNSVYEAIREALSMSGSKLTPGITESETSKSTSELIPSITKPKTPTSTQKSNLCITEPETNLFIAKPSEISGFYSSEMLIYHVEEEYSKVDINMRDAQINYHNQPMTGTHTFPMTLFVYKNNSPLGK